jgi:hypothetical protein
MLFIENAPDDSNYMTNLFVNHTCSPEDHIRIISALLNGNV